MAEITKVTTPMIPRENLGNRNKPISDQAFDLTDPTKVHRAGEDGKILDQQKDAQTTFRDGANQEALAPVLKDVTDLAHIIQKITTMMQMGISTADVVNTEEVQKLLQSLYLFPEELPKAIAEQNNSSVLFKGAAFDLLRDILSKFPDNQRVQNALTNLLKAFENNVNAENSVKTILYTCKNLLDYMFSGDRAQFAQYLEGLSDLLLPEKSPEQTASKPNGQQEPPAAEGQQLKAADDQKAGGNAAGQQLKAAAPADEQKTAANTAEQQTNLMKSAETKSAADQMPGRGLGVEQREAAQILKGNLLPLLGEIVVKYNQNERIRDMVMVVVHNIVRVDQGTPESFQDAITKLVTELKLVANLSEGFEQQLTSALMAAKDSVKDAHDSTMTRLANMISEALSSPNTAPGTLRQAENLLLSLLQNQSSAMNILHFILPMETANGKLFAEMYVDPDSEQKVGRSQDQSRKLFLAFDSENLGAFELSFLETAEKVDFSMWCPNRFLKPLSAMKRQIADVMASHGYTMNRYEVAELVSPKLIADIFPRLLNRRMSVDVRI